MKLLFAAALALLSATVTSATSGLRSGERQLAPAFPPYSQQCRDDAGPPFMDDSPTKKYHNNKPATAVGDCPDALKGACASKPKTEAFLEGPVNCGGRGWFCRILEEPGWNPVALTSDVNFGYCNTTEGYEDAGWDKSGHCHGSDADETFYWWVRDHWHRGYNGRLRCCCGWEDQVKEGLIVNRCDHRRLVTKNEDLEKCRDANEEGSKPYNGGCSPNNSPALNKPIPEDDSKCWEVSKFGEPNDDSNNDDNNNDDNNNNDNDNDNECKDDSSFLFKDIAGRTCQWVGKNPNRLKKFCPQTSNGKKVSASCPVTCDACSGNDNDNDNDNECKDDNSFLFNGKRSCNWIGAKENRIETFCDKNSGGKMVSDYCPETCGECE